jgi:hypothetical protein
MFRGFHTQEVPGTRSGARHVLWVFFAEEGAQQRRLFRDLLTRAGFIFSRGPGMK